MEMLFIGLKPLKRLIEVLFCRRFQVHDKFQELVKHIWYKDGQLYICDGVAAAIVATDEDKHFCGHITTKDAVNALRLDSIEVELPFSSKILSSNTRFPFDQVEAMLTFKPEDLDRAIILDPAKLHTLTALLQDSHSDSVMLVPPTAPHETVRFCLLDSENEPIVRVAIAPKMKAESDE